MPRERVRRAAELLLDQEPLELRPTLAAVLARVEAAAQTGLDRLALDPLLELLGDLPAAELGELLIGDQYLVDEAARTLAQVLLLRCQLARRSRARR